MPRLLSWTRAVVDFEAIFSRLKQDSCLGGFVRILLLLRKAERYDEASESYELNGVY